MASHHGEYTPRQIGQLCLAARGFKDAEIAKIYDGISVSTLKEGRREMLASRPHIPWRSTFGLFLDLYLTGQATKEQLAGTFHTSGLAKLTVEERDVLEYMIESGNCSGHTLETEGHYAERRIPPLRKSIATKLLGRDDASFRTLGVSYFVNTREPVVGTISAPEVPEVMQNFKEEVEGDTEDVVEGITPVARPESDASSLLLFDISPEEILTAEGLRILISPQESTIGEALYRIRQQGEVAVVIDEFPEGRRRQRVYKPRILAVGGGDLAELLYLLSERIDKKNEVEKNFLNEAIPTVSDDGKSASSAFIKKVTPKATVRMYLIGQKLKPIQRDILDNLDAHDGDFEKYKGNSRRDSIAS